MWQGSEFPVTSKTRNLLYLYNIHQNLYQCSVTLIKYKKHHLLNPGLYHQMKLFDEKLYICEMCYTHLNKNEIQCQAICPKLALGPILDELEYLKKY